VCVLGLFLPFERVSQPLALPKMPSSNAIHAAHTGPRSLSAAEGALGAASWHRKEVLGATLLTMLVLGLACVTFAAYAPLHAHKGWGHALVKSPTDLAAVAFVSVFVRLKYAPSSTPQSEPGLAERIVFCVPFWVVWAAVLAALQSLSAMETVALSPPPGGPADRWRYHPNYEYGRAYANAGYIFALSAFLVVVPALLERRSDAPPPTLFKWAAIAFYVLGVGLARILTCLRVISATVGLAALLTLLVPVLVLALVRDWRLGTNRELVAADSISNDSWYLSAVYLLLIYGPWFVATVAASFEDSHQVLAVAVNQVLVAGPFPCV
jgi:hypothetical protein